MSDVNLKDFGRICDALGRIVEAAELQQETADRSIQSMIAATESLNLNAHLLKGQLAGEVQNSLQSASAEAARILASKFVEANQLADEAAACYRHSVRWAAWKVLLSAIVISIALAAGGLFVLQRSFPSYQKMEALRAEHAELTKTVAELEGRGGRAKIAKCEVPAKGPRPCIKIDEQAGRFGDGFWVVSGR